MQFNDPEVKDLMLKAGWKCTNCVYEIQKGKVNIRIWDEVEIEIFDGTGCVFLPYKSFESALVTANSMLEGVQDESKS